MPYPDNRTREACGDVLLVGGTFHLKGKLVLDRGVSFPVEVKLKIGPRSGITFPKVTLVKPADRAAAGREEG